MPATPTALPSTSATSTASDVEARATRRFALAALALVAMYVIAGTFGRFPWKADEPYSFGIVWEILDHDAWLVPTIAGQPFMEKPPLVYWLGALFARTFPAAPPHESARLAVLLLFGVTLASLHAAARWLAPEVQRWLDALARSSTRTMKRAEFARLDGILVLVVAAGTVGFAEHVHKLTADVGQLAGATLALAGLVRIGTTPGRRAAAIAGALLGTGAGLAFMSKGLLVPGLLGVTVACCLALPAYRSRSAGIAFAVALAALLPWAVVWPTWLHAASPALFHQWLWQNNIGRFVGFTRLGGNDVPLESRVLSLLGMGFPALPLAAVTLALTVVGVRRTRHASVREMQAHASVAIYLVVAIVVLAASASMRDVYLLPALPPMILLALPALWRGGWSSPTTRSLVGVFFAATVAVIVAIWLALVARGDLPHADGLRDAVARWLPLPFALHPHAVALVGAISAILLWRELVRNDPLRSAVVAWCAGFAMVWVVAASLLMPWIDTARSYAGTFAALRSRLEAMPGCVATINLGESELALLAYVTRATPVRAYLGPSGVGKRSRPNDAAFACPWLLVRSNRTWTPDIADSGRWQRVWSGGRPADRDERFALYRAY